MLDKKKNSVDRLVVGCGYLGLRVATSWAKQGLQVAVTTRSIEKASRFEKVGLQPIVCDVLDQQSVAQLPESEIVLHAVAVDRSSGQSFSEIYLQGMQNLLAALKNSCKRYFYISSTSVYGQTAGEEITERSPCEPARENGKICLEAENILRQSPVDELIFRLAGIYGEGRLIARMNQVQQAVPVAGNPDAWLNLVHVDDCVAAILAASQRNLQNETILVSDDRPIRRREYYSLLASLMKAPAAVFDADLKDPKGERGAGKRCNNSKLHQLLLETLQFPTIEQGLPDALCNTDF